MAQELQAAVRNNSFEVESFLRELNSWTAEMKAQELAASNKSISNVENVDKSAPPLRNQPQGKSKATTKPQGTDYGAWEKFDAEKACEEGGGDAKVNESEEDKVRRRAIELRLQNMAKEKKELGNQCLKDKNYEKALEYYSEGIRCDKKSAVLYANRAQTYIYLNQFTEAIKDCDETIRLDSNYIKAYFRRAKAFIVLNHFAEAKKDVEKMLSLEPKNMEAKHLLNEINQKKEEAEAIKFPIVIKPLKKSPSKASKRPLLPLHVKFVGKVSEEEDEDEVSEMSSLTTPPESPETPPPSYSESCPASLLSSQMKMDSPISQNPTLTGKLNGPPPKAVNSAQFYSDWKKVKGSSRLAAEYLKQLDAEDYPTLFGQNLESRLLSEVLETLVWEFDPQGWSVQCHVLGLASVPRFPTLVLFMTEKDRAAARKLISGCDPSLQSELFKKYGLL